MNRSARPQAQDFFEIQRVQRQKSFFLLLVLLSFYILGALALVFVLLMMFGMFLPFTQAQMLRQSTINNIAFTTVIVATLGAIIHYYTAREKGARFIRERLRATPPDRSDRYHLQVDNMIEELSLASGFPKVHCYIIPSFAINSMALMEPGGSASILVSEGLLSECTRGEVQAVVAHELAHILRGDALYVTLVCSLVNIFESIREALEPDTSVSSGYTALMHQSDRGNGGGLLFVVAGCSTGVIRLLSALLSRQREIMADAVAVELCRDPMALARGIYKANVRYSFVGGSNDAYSPIFIVDPRSHGLSEEGGFFSRLFNSHPPAMRRIEALTAMAGTTPADVLGDIRRIEREREKDKPVLSPRKTLPAQSGILTGEDSAKQWTIRDHHGQWQGPYTLEELIFIPFFAPNITIRNNRDDIQMNANKFEEIRSALARIDDGTCSGDMCCPRCRKTLSQDYYDGATMHHCSTCGGYFARNTAVEKAIIRRENRYDQEFYELVREFKERVWLNPLHHPKEKLKQELLLCPHCGIKMISHPYNYQYFVPVHKCYVCKSMWFDTNNLEILQILIEETQERGF